MVNALKNVFGTPPFGSFLLVPGMMVVGMVCCGGAQALDAKTIIKNTNAVYKNMKSMQATLETEIVGGKKGSAKTRSDIKVITGKLANIVIQPQGEGTGELGKQMQSSGLRIVDDGKFSWLYQPTPNTYVKNPHKATVFQNVAGGSFNLPYGGMNATMPYKVGAPGNIGGVKTYTLEYVPASPPGIKVTLSIDQSNFHIRQSKVVRVTDDVYSVTTTVKNEVLNAAIPESDFTFTPPKGAVEVKPLNSTINKMVPQTRK